MGDIADHLYDCEVDTQISEINHKTGICDEGCVLCLEDLMRDQSGLKSDE